MKTKFKMADFNEGEKKIALAMLNNSVFASSFIITALQYYITDVFNTNREELQNALGALFDEKEWRKIARQFNTDLLLGVDEFIETPRGRFYYRFNTMEEAKAAGYGYYFEHEKTVIVGDGTHAAAVRDK